jgi:hypothetical protein
MGDEHHNPPRENAVMAKSNELPRHPTTGLYAVGVLDNGRPVWPIMGGDESEEAAAQAQAAKDAADAKAAAEAKTSSERGFPEGTPVAEMTDGQQAAYWKHQSRQHESRVKALGVTPEDLASLREKAKRAEDLEYDLASDKDKAVADAKKEASDEVASKYTPRLVRAEFKAAAAGRIEPEKLATILEPLDLSKFLDANGEVDADKVSAYVDGIAPAKGNEDQGQQQKRGPGNGGQGRREQSRTGASVQSGRDMYRAKYAKS